MYAIRSYYDCALGGRINRGHAAENVITSYSIHYTKLYEDGDEGGHHEFVVAVAPLFCHILGPREVIASIDENA